MRGRSRILRLYKMFCKQIFTFFILGGALFGEETFFRDFFISSMILEEPVGYTLIGEKPISFVVVQKPSSIDLPYLDGMKLKKSALVRGWLEFRKLIERSNTPGYLFLFGEEEDALILTVVNRASFKKKCREIGIDEKLTLSRLERNLGNLQKTFSGRHDLIGICLGFGKHNSILFQQETEKEKKKAGLITEFPLYYYNRSSLARRLVNFSEEGGSLLQGMSLPAFMVDPLSEETRQLREEYCVDRRRILKKLEIGPIQEFFYNYCIQGKG